MGLVLLLWCSRLRIWRCLFNSSDCCCGASSILGQAQWVKDPALPHLWRSPQLQLSSIPGPGTSACRGAAKKEKNTVKLKKKKMKMGFLWPTSLYLALSRRFHCILYPSFSSPSLVSLLYILQTTSEWFFSNKNLFAIDQIPITFKMELKFPHNPSQSSSFSPHFQFGICLSTSLLRTGPWNIGIY